MPSVHVGVMPCLHCKLFARCSCLASLQHCCSLFSYSCADSLCHAPSPSLSAVGGSLCSPPLHWSCFSICLSSPLTTFLSACLSFRLCLFTYLPFLPTRRDTHCRSHMLKARTNTPSTSTHLHGFVQQHVWYSGKGQVLAEAVHVGLHWASRGADSTGRQGGAVHAQLLAACCLAGELVQAVNTAHKRAGQARAVPAAAAVAAAATYQSPGDT